ncbi:hypothetical protein [Streptomyces sp. NPDC006463]|uniref:hypothetical protein n=1 Tax=Streptomyces sp. NPDC006463 TaxID=3364746 RepID=UPI0036D0E2CA
MPLTLKVNAFSSDQRDGQRASFFATSEINRRDFGINAGGVALSDKSSISLEIQAVLHN